MWGLFLASQISQAIVFFLVNYNSNHSRSDLGEGNWFISRDPDDISFYLYKNPKDVNQFSEIKISNVASLLKSGLNASLPIVFLIHGLVANINTTIDVQQIKNAYLAVKFPANIIMVDYGELANVNIPGYGSILNLPASLFANFNAPIVGQRVAEFIQFLIQNGALASPDRVHLVGFSLGCHVSGAAGTHVKKLLGSPIARISGLDCPGGQLFPSNLLDKSDATFVDITHTSFGRVSGILGSIGHADFFINAGGPKQPKCLNSFLISEPYCSHVSAVYYFAKSIRQNIGGCKCKVCAFYFPSCPAGNSIIYGQNVSQRARGKYYVRIS